MMNNELLFIVEGTDTQARIHRGVYNAADKDYLLASDSLNKVVAVIDHRGKIHSTTNERTN